MTTLAIVHVAVVAALVGLALVLDRSRRWRELGHAVWVLVLVKLLVPPFVGIPVLAPATAEQALAPADLGVAPALESAALESPALESLMLAPAAVQLPVDDVASGSEGAHVFWSSGLELLAWIWLVGALVGAFRLGRSVLRFRTVLRGADGPTPALREATDRAAAALGLNRTPRVLRVAAPVSPALWPSRQPALVLPERLVDRLSPAELHHVLMHELAHYARRDHRVRLLEAVVQVAYWWLPLLPWLRGRLRESEEACCDARVLRAGGDGHTYASALIRALEVLQHGRQSLPSFATAALSGSALSNRIHSIMLDQPRRPVGLAFRCTIVAALLGLLPLLPVRVGAAEPSTPVAGPWTLAVPAASTGLAFTPQSGDEPVHSDVEAAVLARVDELLQAGSMDAAAAVLEEARGPSASAVLDFTAGSVARAQGRPQQAERAFVLAVDKDPTYGRAWESLGLVRMERGDPGGAVEAFEHAIEHGGGSARLYGLCASARLELGDGRGAESAFWMANLLDPDASAWRQGILTALVQQGRSAHALTLAGQMLGKRPGDVGLRQLVVNLHLSLGQVERAEEHLAAIEAQGAATSETLLLHAELCLRGGRSAEALEHYRSAVCLDPTLDRVRLERGARYLESVGETAFGLELWDLSLQSAQTAAGGSGEQTSAGPEGALRGTVRDRDLGSPLGGCRVTVVELAATASTNQAGAYLFEALPQGTYTLEFYRAGYAIERKASVRVSAHALAQVDAALSGQLAALEKRTGLAEPEVVVLALRGTEVLYGGRNIGLDGVRPLLERLFEEGILPVQITAMQAVEFECLTRVMDEAKLAGAESVELARQDTVELRDLDAPPKPIAQRRPILTQELRRHAPASVTVAFLLDESGRVRAPSIHTSSDPRFEESALEAVASWRYAPGRVKGRPVSVRMRITFTFPEDSATRWSADQIEDRR